MMDIRYLEARTKEWYRIVAALLYLTAVSITAHLLNKNLIAFVLAPGVFLFHRPTKPYLVFLVLGCNILFFEFFMFHSDFGPFSIQDSVIFAYFFLRFVTAKDMFSFRIPMSVLLLVVYLFVIHGLIMSLVSYKSIGYDVYLVMDTRSVLYLLLIPLLLNGDFFSPKNLTRIFLSIVFFSTVFSVISIISFIVTGKRVVCWSDIFFSDGFIIALVLVPMIGNPRIKKGLVASAALCFVALLTTQMRSIWLSTTAFSVVYCFLLIGKSKTFPIAKALWVLAIAVCVILLAHVLLLAAVNLDLPTFVVNRLVSGTKNGDVANAGSSLGFRIYESYMIWRNKTLFGHGSGARIYLLFTQSYPFKFLYWWCIHSGYFELLHKYGFFGLGLYLGFVALALKRAVGLMREQKRVIQTFGTIVLLTLLNHCMINIAAPYLFRENVMIYLVILIGIVEYYKPRRSTFFAGVKKTV